MKLSEAISLGHTLIGEERACFLNGVKLCGCAIGSAYAATEGLHEDPEHEYGQLVTWLEGKWRWTGEKPTEELVCQLGAEPLAADCPESAAGLISYSHYKGMPRMQIAAIIAKHEPAEASETAPQVEREAMA